MLDIQPSGEACGALATGIDLSKPLGADAIAALRAAWLANKVLALPDQRLTDSDLVRVTQYLGGVGDDPFFESIAPDNPVVALTRRADEKAPLFAESWHSDWSFKVHPPIGTCLYGITIPPVGGNTGFINQALALAEMPDALRGRIDGRKALHSAAGAYAPDGMYGNRETEADRSMKIIYSEKAREVQAHPFIITHPETGEETLFGCAGYIVGIEDMAQDEAAAIIGELYQWQTQARFQYTHRWQKNMLTIWDNRSVLHRAYGGYDGYARELHRTTIAGAA